MAAPSPKQRAVTMKRNGMDDSLVGAILGLSSSDVRALVYEAEPAVDLDVPVDIRLASVTLGDEEIKALPDAPVELVPDPGSGRLAIPLYAFMLCDSSGGFYENIGDRAQVTVISSKTGLHTQAGKLLSLLNEQAGNDVSALLSAEDKEWAVFTGAQSLSLVGVEGIFPQLGSNVDFLGGLWLSLANINQATGTVSIGDLTGGHADNFLSVGLQYMIIPVDGLA